MLWRYFLHLIWPVSCELCGRPGVMLCEKCREILRKKEAEDSRAKGFYRIFSDKIITRKFGSLTVYSALYHHDVNVKKVIHAFKEDGRKDMGRPLGVCMAKSFGGTEADYIIPAPLRMNSERKYNQTTELAKGMCDYWGVELLDVSERTRERPHQMSLGARDRKNNIAPDDFRFTQDIRGLRVALVDDVCTTGYTLMAFYEACRQAGAVVTCAYTLSSSNR
ncbi:MAG: ComF family protein [Synergistaceae bacterium]|nr:ComF family protein [Synergistaceae bacterium]